MKNAYDITRKSGEVESLYADSFRITESGALIFKDGRGREFGAIHKDDWLQVWSDYLEAT